MVSGPEPYVPIPGSLCTEVLVRCVRENIRNTGKCYEGVFLQLFSPEPHAKWAKNLLKINRNRIRKVVGAITGHCRMNRHLNKLRLSVTLKRSCGLEEEKVIHIIYEYPKFFQLKRRLQRDYMVESLDVSALGTVTLYGVPGSNALV